MKKIILIILLALLTFSVSYAYADGRRSCSVYNNADYTAELLNGSTMAQANKDGRIFVSVKVSGPQISSYRNGSLKVQVYVNAIDRTSKTVAGTGDKTIYVKDSPYSSSASGSESITIEGLTPNVYYEISIDNATCN